MWYRIQAINSWLVIAIFNWWPGSAAASPAQPTLSCKSNFSVSILRCSPRKSAGGAHFSSTHTHTPREKRVVGARFSINLGLFRKQRQRASERRSACLHYENPQQRKGEKCQGGGGTRSLAMAAHIKRKRSEREPLGVCVFVSYMYK